MTRSVKLGAVLLASSLGVIACGPVYTSPVPLAPGATGAQAAKTPAKQAFVPGEVIVKFRNTGNFGATLNRYGLSSKSVVPRIGAMVTKTQGDVLETVKKLKADPSVVYAEPNYVETILDGAPNDPDYDKQYAPQITQAPQGWTITKGDPNVLLAIVDTGIDATHPDLAAKTLKGWNQINGTDNAADGHGHGTHCAGIAAAITNNGVGMAGIAPNNKIFGVKVLSDQGSGTTADVSAGIIKAVDMGAKVISLSLGGRSPSASRDEAVKYAISKDVLLVAAMGNDGGNVTSYPAAIPGVMAVGSTDAADKRSSFSNYGTWISVSAPGSKIWSTLPMNGSAMGKAYGYASGTSMATPAVAGLAALVRSQFPQYTYAQTRAKIEAAADDIGAAGFDNEYGHGRINVYKALQAVRR